MRYLKTFFEEKEIQEQEFEVTGRQGETHFISTNVVIEAILNAPENEQQKIAATIRKIDFKNGDIVDYLRHLAKGLAMNY